MPRTGPKPQPKVMIFTAGWKNIAACDPFKKSPGLKFQRPPTNQAFHNALIDAGHHFDFVFPTLFMSDPDAHTGHIGLHATVALPPRP